MLAISLKIVFELFIISRFQNTYTIFYFMVFFFREFENKVKGGKVYEHKLMKMLFYKIRKVKNTMVMKQRESANKKEKIQKSVYIKMLAFIIRIFTLEAFTDT